ncbi:MAG: hypothetical protein J2O47_00035 [Acidimicrobiaceae bacterium]|nr:hypothetical protein [Acidimicrobiaceae bacterium]
MNSKGKAVAAVFAATAIVLLFSAGSALAAPSRSLDSSFASDNPNALAVDQSNGDVYVVDPVNNLLRRYDASGNPDPFSALSGNAIDGASGADGTPAGGFSFDTSSQVAVDNSGGPTDGNIYVVDTGADFAGTHGTVDIFDQTGTYLGQLTGSTTPQGNWAVNFAYPCGVAVDGNGTVYVSTPFPGGIDRFVPSGAFPTDADYQDQISGVFPAALAVDSAGNVYGTQNFFATPAPLIKWQASDFGTDAPPGTQVADNVTAVSIDPSTDDVYADEGDHVSVLVPGGASESYTFGSSADFGTNSAGVAVKGSNGNAYVADLTNNQIDVYKPFALVTKPIVARKPATAIGPTSATLNADVNPGGAEVTDCHFEYVTEADFQANGFTGAETAPCVPDPGSGNSSVSVSADVTGLVNDTTYHFRAVATNSAGTTDGAERSFKTLAAVKELITLPATQIQAFSARLKGSLNPGGVAVSDCHFQYTDHADFLANGFTAAQSAPCTPDPGSSANVVAVAADIAGLGADTAYDFRLTATNSDGTTYGQVQSFTTVGVAITADATVVHHTSAQLNGRLEPHGDPGITACYFDWGTDNSYGNTTACTEGDDFSAAADVSAQLTNLTPGAEIHFRLHLTTTDHGDAVGHDRTFAPPSLPNVSEQVAAFGPDGTAGTSFPGSASTKNALAIDQTAHKLYLLNGPNGTYGFDASVPPAVSPLPDFSPDPTLSAAGFDTGIAVDNSNLPSQGHIYVSDGEGGTVRGFDSTGAALGGNYPIDVLTNPGPPASGDFNQICGVSTDPSGNLWVNNFSGNRVLGYTPAGAFQLGVTAIHPDSATGQRPCKTAFALNGDMYQSSADKTYRATVSSDYSTGRLVDPGKSQAVAVDPSNGRVFVAHDADFSVYDDHDAPLASVPVPGAGLSSIAVDGTSHYIYAASGASKQVLVFAPLTPLHLPTVTPADPTDITTTSATLNAKVDPEATPVTDCHFDYGTDSSYGQSAPCDPAPGSGSGDVAVSADLAGLEPHTTYHFRISASSADGEVHGSDQTLSTSGPRISDTRADPVTATTATLRATLNPGGEPTTYHFEYGTDTSYGSSTHEAGPLDGNADRPLAELLDGLAPATTYHVRLIATNASGTTTGPDAAFTTSASLDSCPNAALRTGYGSFLPDCRAYEQASPVDKNGSDVGGSRGFIQAATSGDRVTFIDPAGLPTTGGTSHATIYLASRANDDWTTDGLLPPTPSGADGTNLAWSADLSSSASDRNVDGTRSFLFRDSDTGAFTAAASWPSDSGITPTVSGYSASGDDAIIETTANLATGAVSGAPNLYQVTPTSVSLVSRVPPNSDVSCNDAGSPACVPAPNGSFAGPYDWQEANADRAGASGLGGDGAQRKYYTSNTLSADGSSVFFTERGTGRLFVRQNGTTTTWVSAPAPGTTPDPNGTKPAAWLASTPSGSKVFFSSCERLTDDSTAVSTAADACTTSAQGQDLYLYDTTTGDLTDLTPDANPGDLKGAQVVGFLGASADGSDAYFMANGDLDGAGPATAGDCSIASQTGTCNLYHSHAGQPPVFVASLTANTDSTTEFTNWQPNDGATSGGFSYKRSRVSADGTLLFASSHSLTGYDNGAAGPDQCGLNDSPADTSCLELFRYTPSGDLTCVSCNPAGSRPTGAADVQRNDTSVIDAGAFVTPVLPRNISPDGTRIFFNSADKLLPADVNGDDGCPGLAGQSDIRACTDVYEWEAEGTGSCASADQNGGCLYLLSSGQGDSPSFFADASTNGDDAFIFTRSPLVPQDTDDLVDVYDARVGGGLSSQHPVPPPPPCSGAACQHPPTPPPAEPGPGSTASGQGNQGTDRTPKAKHPRHKKRCSKKHHKRNCKKHKKHHKHHRRNLQRTRTADLHRRAAR